MLTRDAAPGIHRLAFAGVSCYLIEERGALTLVDAGLPVLWRHLARALDALGRTPADVRALVLTHAHFDHLGVAARVQREWGVPVSAHPADHEVAAQPYSYAHELPRVPYVLQHREGLPVLARMLRAGAWHVPPISGLRSIAGGQILDVPGAPTVLSTPGHTPGHCVLHLPGSDAVITGDALVTLDPYNGRTGPRIISGAATADTALALASLDVVAATGAGVVLPGHGEPWRAGAGPAVAAAREAASLG